MVRVEFGVLGEVCAWADGQAIELGPARQRHVLAALLVKVNQPISLDQLADCVWGEAPPQRASGTLHSYLSRLRTSLPAAWDGGIRRGARGYVLRAEDSAVDLHRFRALLAQARASDDTEAAHLYERALGLWRGEPLDGLHTPWAVALRHTLQAEQFAARLDHHDVRLRRGEHAALLGTLDALATEHPLDERLTAQLILALYRSGRQTDAFDRYEWMRRRLAEELGVDPGPELQLLHRQILTASPALAPAPPVAVPRQLPSPPPVFIGRQKDLALLDGALTGDGPRRPVMISAVGGAGGIGKTWLVLHWAYRDLGRFPDGQIYLDLRGFDATNAPMPVETALRILLGALAVDPSAIPQEPQEQAALYRGLTAGKRMLIVLDNVRDSAQVVPLLPGGSSCTVLVTSRHQLAGLLSGHGARHVPLDVLDAAESRLLLRRLLGSARVDREPEAVAALVERCAGLPLALSIIAARAMTSAGLPLTELAAELLADATRLDALDAGELPADLRAVFAASYRALSPAAALMFRLMGLHAGPDISLPAVASLTGTHLAAARRTLAELARAHVVTEHTPGRFALHDLLRVYAAEQAHAEDGEAERRAALRRLLDHYLHTAYNAALLFYPNRRAITLAVPLSPGAAPAELSDARQAAGWLAAEHRGLLPVIEQAVGAGFTTHAWQLAWSLADFLDRQAHWHDLLAMQRVALNAAVAEADLLGQHHAHQAIGRASMRLDLYDDARTHLDLALGLSVRLGDQVAQAEANHGLSVMYGHRGRHEEALYHAEQALELHQAMGNRIGVALALNGVGWHQANLGRHREAIGTCDQALSLFQELDDRYGQAATLDSLGYAHHHLGDHDLAVERYRQALELFREVGDRVEEGQCLERIGDAHQDAGDGPQARQAWQAALNVIDELGRPGDDPLRTKLQAKLQT
ncbi:BTAD domain-containing putative transcriptional regulator [Nonomuraea sp. CA-141351]|uniref:AfsR/SARP family transcriptional regulator n=1 Tax=Nonomuraea sp. CA-141351 TaxID=3239996 RepID=UPI003D8F19B9